MCLIALAWRAHPRYDLVLAANRDEFHARAADAAAFWPDAPQVFGGRDRAQGGSWLALSTAGRLAAVTNVRRMQVPDPAAPSRGALVADYVRVGREPQQLSRYAGFNLLLWDGGAPRYLSNQAPPQTLAPGVHGLSNATLNTPWPKLLRLRETLSHWCAAGTSDPAPLFAALRDERAAEDHELPDTGVGLEMERLLSAPFIRSSRYGTRASTLVCIRGEHAEFTELRFDDQGQLSGRSEQIVRLSGPTAL